MKRYVHHAICCLLSCFLSSAMHVSPALYLQAGLSFHLWPLASCLDHLCLDQLGGGRRISLFCLSHCNLLESRQIFTLPVFSLQCGLHRLSCHHRQLSEPLPQLTCGVLLFEHLSAWCLHASLGSSSDELHVAFP